MKILLFLEEHPCLNRKSTVRTRLSSPRAGGRKSLLNEIQFLAEIPSPQKLGRDENSHFFRSFFPFAFGSFLCHKTVRLRLTIHRAELSNRFVDTCFMHSTSACTNRAGKENSSKSTSEAGMLRSVATLKARKRVEWIEVSSEVDSGDKREGEVTRPRARPGAANGGKSNKQKLRFHSLSSQSKRKIQEKATETSKRRQRRLLFHKTPRQHLDVGEPKDKRFEEKREKRSSKSINNWKRMTAY